MTRLVLATRNRHKIEEIRRILGPGIECLSLLDFEAVPEIVEDAANFAGNATKKAVGLTEWLGHPKPRAALEQRGWTHDALRVLADDSGLEVDALGGQPGVRSARFAAKETGATANSSDTDNNHKLLRLLAGVPEEQRTARFRCVLALAPVVFDSGGCASPACAASEAELRTELFEGTCEGRIAPGPTGSNGFGYDPLFIPDGYRQSFGELGPEVKDRLSHRARALEQLRCTLARWE